MHKEDELLREIKKFYSENGYPPTIRDLCAILCYKSTSTVANYMDRLKYRGDIIQVGKSYTVKGIKVTFDETE